MLTSCFWRDVHNGTNLFGFPRFLAKRLYPVFASKCVHTVRTALCSLIHRNRNAYDHGRFVSYLHAHKRQTELRRGKFRKIFTLLCFDIGDLIAKRKRSLISTFLGLHTNWTYEGWTMHKGQEGWHYQSTKSLVFIQIWYFWKLLDVLWSKIAIKSFFSLVLVTLISFEKLKIGDFSINYA